jgi:hypothetical protein
VALPALQLKVTLEELKVDPGGGLSITAGPVVANARQAKKITAKKARPFMATSYQIGQR